MDSNSDTCPTKQTLFTCVDTFLRAASPLMPFLTEELFQRLHICNDKRAESICVASYPSVREVCNGRLMCMKVIVQMELIDCLNGA